MSNYDVIVIGAGPAGYVAALRCAQLGLNTACIDAQRNTQGKPALGGTCLNVGCIPSKALLDSSAQFDHAQHHFAAHGIHLDHLRLDVAQMQARKQGIVDKLTAGIGQLFKANGVTSIFARARLLAARQVETVDVDSGEQQALLSAEHIILAPGSVPVELPSARFDHDKVVDSSGALCFEQVPARLGIIGAGVVGLELGSVWRRLGAEVVLLEALPEFLAAADHQVARAAAREFHQQGLDIRLGARLQKIKTTPKACLLHYAQKGEAAQVEVDRVVVAVGRRAATEGLLAADCGVGIDAQARIEVDAECRTAVPNVWAIGDAVRGPMLAHKGTEEGVAVAERIAGGQTSVDFHLMPWVIYTSPEIAWAGETENALKQRGVPYKVGAFPFAASGRAYAMQQPVGFVKLLAHADTDQLLGAHLFGPHVSEVLAEAVLGMEFSASAEDFARTVHAHPTLSEALHEAALAVDKRALHKVN